MYWVIHPSASALHTDAQGNGADKVPHPVPDTTPLLHLLTRVRVRLLATRRRASLYIGAIWIRLPQELHMKRLPGLLLGMVGCEGEVDAPLMLRAVTISCLAFALSGVRLSAQTPTDEANAKT